MTSAIFLGFHLYRCESHLKTIETQYSRYFFAVIDHFWNGNFPIFTPCTPFLFQSFRDTSHTTNWMTTTVILTHTLHRQRNINTNHVILYIYIYIYIYNTVDGGKSCTTKDDDYPIIYRDLSIPGGCLGFLNHQQYHVYFSVPLHFVLMFLHVFAWPQSDSRRHAHLESRRKSLASQLPVYDLLLKGP